MLFINMYWFVVFFNGCEFLINFESILNINRSILNHTMYISLYCKEIKFQPTMLLCDEKKSRACHTAIL